jgi:hypothetical protein
MLTGDHENIFTALPDLITGMTLIITGKYLLGYLSAIILY